ncbi:metallophosphoesterase [Pseudomonas sp. ICMP 561]|uniref:metallophosphoesterase n=1 Tax=Pseudomonas sp. ICMP 561 TaxID=1718918 RepID=UPI000C08D57D|nr:metallophosphoesterase [Pseudomonas sp. ICMP 561]PHN17282.1 serine/threonine protein phosphatase [Pseudomonas sp. ICMP 561]
MRARIYSDLHLEFEKAILSDLTSEDADVVILAGDIHQKNKGVLWAQKAFSVPVIYVSGNHEFYRGHLDRTLEAMRSSAEGSNVHVLENESIVINGVRFLGATTWTDFSANGSVYEAAEEAKRLMNDFRLIRVGSNYRRINVGDLISRNHQTHAWLTEKLAEDFGGKTVVVSHHCPLRGYADSESSSPLLPAYSNEWPELVSLADAWIFGHTHSLVDAVVDGCRLISNPRGYPGENCGFDPRFTILLD